MLVKKAHREGQRNELSRDTLVFPGSTVHHCSLVPRPTPSFLWLAVQKAGEPRNQAISIAYGKSLPVYYTVPKKTK